MTIIAEVSRCSLCGKVHEPFPGHGLPGDPCIACGHSHKWMRKGWCSPCWQRARRVYARTGIWPDTPPVRPETSIPIPPKEYNFQCNICGLPLSYKRKGRYPQFCSEHPGGRDKSPERKLRPWASTREELVANVPVPPSIPCRYRADGCNREVNAKASRTRNGWYWGLDTQCTKCRSLYGIHHLKFPELIALWEAQDRQCYLCRLPLDHPRADTWRQKSQINIDHDHDICPRKNHSCDDCRRGLACHKCNSTVLVITDYAYLENSSFWLALFRTDDHALAIEGLRAAIGLLDPSVQKRKNPAIREKNNPHLPGMGLCGLKGVYWLHQHPQRVRVVLSICPFLG